MGEYLAVDCLLQSEWSLLASTTSLFHHFELSLSVHIPCPHLGITGDWVFRNFQRRHPQRGYQSRQLLVSFKMANHTLRSQSVQISHKFPISVPGNRWDGNQVLLRCQNGRPNQALTDVINVVFLVLCPRRPWLITFLKGSDHLLMTLSKR